MAKDELRKKKSKKEPVSSSMDPELVLRLEGYCMSKDHYRANVIERAVEKHLDKEGFDLDEFLKNEGLTREQFIKLLQEKKKK